MVKLNKKKGRRSGKRIQYNLARKSLKKKSKRNNKSKKVFKGGFLLPKSNEYDDKATISFDINNCNNQSRKITFKSQDNMKELTNDDDKKNFVLLKHRVLDEKTSTPSRKTPLYEAYFKIPKIIFSLCRQKSKGDKNNLKLTVQYQETGKQNSFDINHTCNQKSIFNKFVDNLVKNQLETDAKAVKNNFENALKNHTSYDDKISNFLEQHKKQLSEKTIENIKRRHNLDKGDEKEEKETETEKEKHIVKEECDETKQLLKGMTFTIESDGSLIIKKNGKNTKQSMNNTINNIATSMKNIDGQVIVDPNDSNEQEDANEPQGANSENKKVQTTSQNLTDSGVQTTPQASQAQESQASQVSQDNAPQAPQESQAQAQESKDEEVKAAIQYAIQNAVTAVQ